MAYNFSIIKKNIPLAYRLEFKVAYKTNQALFQVLRLGIISGLGYEPIFFCLVGQDGSYSC